MSLKKYNLCKISALLHNHDGHSHYAAVREMAIVITCSCWPWSQARFCCTQHCQLQWTRKLVC